jgi:hypothetical protein
VSTEVEQDPCKRWIAEIDVAEKELKHFHKRAKNVVKRFLDERDTLNSASNWFNIFYANTNILESALYSQLPKPLVSRRFKDYDDDIARVASIIIQRSISQDLDDPRDTFDSAVRQCVQDRLVPGLGQAWLRLETTTEAIDDVIPEGQPDTEEEAPEAYQRITDQRVCVDYVFWNDFLWSPCRVWNERRWIARRVYMSRDALEKRFPRFGKLIPLDFNPTKLGDDTGVGSTPKDEAVKKAVIYEIWERKSRRVFWISKGFGQILDEQSDPLGLVGFEPCPTPMLANISTSNCTPRPDHYMIQDQYNELDNINNRISKLIKACKVVGVYDKSAVGVARMLKEGFDNDLIPVDNWAAFAEKGGVKGQVDWLPLEVVVQALNQLNIAREAIKAQIYELTGIADIVRGASKASETLGAQEIKAKFASVRIKKLQDEVARFAAEILRIKAEIQIRHFEPEILLKISNIEATPDAPLAMQAMDLLKSDEGFEWRITVTADSIAQADYDMEKQDRMGFLTAVSGYLEKAGAMFQTVPQSAPLLVGMLKWAIAGFRNATEIEGMMDKALDDLTKNPPEDKPNPEAQKAQVEQQKIQQQMHIEQQKADREAQAAERQLQIDEQRAQMETTMDQQANEMKLAMEQQMGELKIWLETTLAHIKLQGAQQQADQKAQEHAMNLAQDSQQHDLKMKTVQETSALAVETKKAEAKAAATAKPAKKE